MFKPDITDPQRILLDILSASLNNTQFEFNQTIDWREVYRESRNQAVTLLASQSVRAEIMDSACAAIWTQMPCETLYNNIEINKQHSYVHNLLTKNNINYCILKGCSSAFYYPDPLMRTMGDVDFLIANEDMSKVSELLCADGFEPWHEKHICHVVFRRNREHLEVHFEPAGVPEGKCGKIIRSYLGNIFDCSETVSIGNNTFRKPGDFHHGLILLMHMYHHMLAEGIGLRHLCDWAAFINKFDNNEFVMLFREKLTDVGLWNFACILGYTVHLSLKIPYREWMGEQDEKLCSDLLQDIIKSGNFGCKDKARGSQGFAISNRGKDGIKKSLFGQAYSSMSGIVKTKYPRAYKMKIFTPFLIGFLIVKHGIRVLLGKRKRIKIRDTFKKAEERRKIYDQFHLYEIG